MLRGDAALHGIEEVTALRRRADRDRTGRYVIEGARFVHVAVRSRTPIVRGFVAPEMLDRSAREAASLLRRRTDVEEIDARAFRRLSCAGEPTGVAAIVEQRWKRLERPPRDGPALWVAFGGLRSPGNLGTTLRTAAAAGARGALFLDEATDPFDPVAVRASMGAVLSLPLVRVTPAHLGAWSRRTGALVVGTSAHGRRDVAHFPRHRATVVMLGCERKGMSRAQRRVCDVMVRIPMAPGTSSLNVAVAAGILLFAARERSARR